MATRKLGTTDIAISPIVMGMWQAGKQYWVGVRDQDITDAVRRSLYAGVTSFDTAEIYGDGHSEALLGAALQGVRDQAVIMTKVWSANLARDRVIQACEGSLKRLRTDRIDLYQIHWPSGSWNSEVVPIEETMEALVRLREQGKILAIGVSNFDRAQVTAAAACGPIDSVQPSYSLFWRHADRELRPWCQASGATILAYSPLAQGLLTGRYRPGHAFEKGDARRQNKLFSADTADVVNAALDQLEAMARDKGCTMAQLALAWTIRQPNTCALPGARNVAQAVSNAGAMAVALSEDELAEVDRIGRAVADLAMDDPLLWNWRP